MATAIKARVFMSGRSQHVTIPAEYRFSTDEVYLQRDMHSGALTLSEKPPKRPMAEILKMLDEAGAADFELERDMRPEPERDLFNGVSDVYAGHKYSELYDYRPIDDGSAAL